MARHEKPRASENWTGNYKSALVLADSIRDYWFDRGFYSARVWTVERVRKRPDGSVRTDYDIRSNLIGGKPPECFQAA